MKSEISAFVDGELDGQAAQRCLQGMRQDGDLRRAWDDYQLIGDALRGDTGPALDATFARRLEAEPTILAPKPAVAANNSRWMPALSAAAGVAVVAFAAWIALPQVGTEAGLVATAPVAPSAQIAAAPGGTGARSAAGAGVPVAVGVEDYLLAHQRFSPASSIQGVAPYVRTVSAERKGDGR
jgi:sigma-E factor negative regulatory protein RseA